VTYSLENTKACAASHGAYGQLRRFTNGKSMNFAAFFAGY